MINTGLTFAIVDSWRLPAWLAFTVWGMGSFLAILLVINRVPVMYNVLNMVVRWRNTLLSAMAFTMVIGLLTVMQAFVNGMYRLTETSGQPGNVLILAEGALDEAFSSLAMADSNDIANQPGILKDGEQPLVSCETYLLAAQSVPQPEGKTKRRFLQIRGLVDPVMAGRVHGMTLDAGEWFSEAGIRPDPDDVNAAPLVEVVMGAGMATEMGRDRGTVDGRSRREFVVGDRFELNNRVWYVTGILKRTGSSFDSEIWSKQSVVGPMFGKERYTTMVARTADNASAQKLKEFFNTEYTKAQLSAEVESEYYKKLSQTNEQFLYAIIIVACIMAIGGSFGVMNTMYAAVSQRIKDIGVLQLMGFKRRHILVSFVLESLLLALFGGLLGCLIGLFADGWTANSVVSGSGGGGKSVVLELTVDGATLISGLMLAMVMGLIGGFLPAISALRLRALDALR